MKNIRIPSVSFFLPWLAPLVVKFVLAHGGIEVQLYKNDQLIENWQKSTLYRLLPAELTQWIDTYHIATYPQPYPLMKQFWQYLLPFASKKLIIDASVLAELEEGSQPQDFGLVWELNRSLERIEGRYQGADHYLGMGWFHRGTQIWVLNTPPSNAADAQLKNLSMPIEQADSLLNLSIPHLQQFLPTRADFQLITDFAVQVIVLEAQYGMLMLALRCNYPQLLLTLQIPQQKVDMLLAHQTVIHFPRRTFTSVLMQLLQYSASITLRGPNVALFIRDQLPIMRHYHQISDDIAAKIIESNPIVSIATLKPALSLSHKLENGVGTYTVAATYQYQLHTLNMPALLAAHQRNQRFAQQQSIWFEWPDNSAGLANTIQQQLAVRVLRSEEVMGFDTQQTVLLQNRLTISTIQPIGATPAERGQSVFEQLRDHGVPGGIIGEPQGILLAACEMLWRNNRQARILWLVPSSAKGRVTRAINNSDIKSYVTVASLVTLRDEVALFSHSWTLVVFQALDQLLDGSPQARRLAQLKWDWAFLSITSKSGLSRSLMSVLHIPEQYYEQFCARYLFDLKSNAPHPQPNPVAPPKVTPLPSQPYPRVPAQKPALESIRSKPTSSPIYRTIKLNQHKIVKLHEESSVLQERLTVEDEEEQLSLQSDILPVQKEFKQSGVKPPAFPALSPTVQLDVEAISKLREESAYLQDRLVVETEEDTQKRLSIHTVPDVVPVAPMVRETVESTPDVDEDWQIILQQWQPEHWEIMRLLCQEKSVQLDPAQRKNHRPVSLLIDEINAPVDEQLGDLLIDPETQMLAPHLRVIADTLVRWYDSSSL